MPIVTIQGINCHYRGIADGEEVLYENLPQEEQYFKIINIPFTDDNLVDIANKEYEYTSSERAWVEKQNRIFDNGIYAYINGEKTFIPGAYYCYVNFWTLEHGEKPDYREDDREFFLFHEYLRLETNCLGATRLKARRQGATSIAMFFMWFIAGRQEHKLCGSTSFTDTAAQDNFQRMFMYGFKAMIPCFQSDFDSSSDNFIRFVKPVDKKKKGVLAVKREGLNSYVDFKSNAINSYDSGRQSYNCPDESAKRGSKLNINSYWSRLSKTLCVGINKVGFAYLPTTVGAKNEGGENYKLFFKNSNQYAIDIKTGEPVGLDTPTRVVQYFMPATKCYAGCIDKFGKSVIDDPKEPVQSNDGRWIKEGARTIILRERAKLEGEQIMEHRRDYPLDVYDAFAFETGQCEFNEKRIIDLIEHLERNPEEAYWRQSRLTETINNEGRIIVDFVDDPKGDWWIKEGPEKPNSYKSIGGEIEITNSLGGSIGADTYRNIFAEDGSEGVLVVTTKSRLVNGEEKGMRPVAIFVGRPKLIKQFNRQAFLACLWYGFKINFEIDAGSWFFEDFMEWHAVRLLEWEPARDPLRKERKIKPGTESASGFQLAKQLEVCKMYFDGTSIGGYNGHGHLISYIPLLRQALDYNHSERTPYHLVVAFQMSLLPILHQTVAPKQTSARTVQMLPTYKINIG